MTYIKKYIIIKLQKLCSLPRKLETGNKSLALFLKKPLCMGDLLSACKIAPAILRAGYCKFSVNICKKI